MTYTAWSVILGEVPTDAKWNQLGDNDASFRDGTGIDDDTILARHLDFADGMMWEEVSRATLTSPNQFLTCNIATADSKRHLRVLGNVSMSGAGSFQNFFYFNGNVGSNSYARNFRDNYGAQNLQLSSSGFGAGGIPNNAGARTFVMDIVNIATESKTVLCEIAFFQFNEQAAAYAAHENKQIVKWTNTTDLITRIQCYSGAPSFDAGSEMIVLARD